MCLAQTYNMESLEFSFLFWIQDLHTPLLDQVMVGLSFLGNAGWLWIVIGVGLFCIKKTRPCGAAVLLSLAVGFLIGNCLLKNMVARSRPCWIMNQEIMLLIPVPRDYSFPSGHTLAGIEASLSILFFYRKWGMAALILAGFIGFSRLYLFVHFPTDVLAGAVLGAGIAIFVHWLIETRQSKVKYFS